MGRVTVLAKPLHIDTWDAIPVASSCRPLHGDKKSPVPAVMKPDGSWRVCGDFRRLNMATKSDKYPLPRFNDDLAGCTIFSKNDMRRAYQQVKIDEHSQHKTATITTLGLFKFHIMAYELKNAGQCFQ